MQIKICGITNIEDALASYEYGADTLGFIFYTRSPRSITWKDYEKIQTFIPSEVKKVGVFVDESAEESSRLAQKWGLDYIQLHGGQTIEEKMSVASIQVFTKESKESLSAFADYYLMDSALGEKKVLESALSFYLKDNLKLTVDTQRLILSGGLHSENIREYILRFRPMAVDIAKGVELQPGKKCLSKLRAFIENAQKAFKEIG